MVVEWWVLQGHYGFSSEVVCKCGRISPHKKQVVLVVGITGTLWVF